MRKKTLAMCIVLELLLVSLFSVIQLPTGKMGRSAYASPSSPVWHKTFGGAGQDMGIQVLQTSDGYAVAALRGGSQAWLIKTDLAGNEQWNKTFGNAYPCGMCQTSDGGYVMFGRVSAGGLKSSHWMVKTDAAGNVQWNRVYGFVGFQNVVGMAPTRDGGYALIGYTSSFGAGGLDAYLVKTDAAGYMQWNKTYGGQWNEYGRCVVQTSDGGYALAGSTTSFNVGKSDFYLVKTDGAGNVQWSKAYAGAGSEGANSLVVTSDGGYALAGTTDSFGSKGTDFYLVKTDKNGNLQWSNAYGGAGNEAQFGLIQTNGGGYAITGSTASFGAGNGDFWLVKTDAYGTMSWNKTYGGIMAEYGCSAIQTSDGGYALIGGTSSFGADSYDVWLVKVDEVGTAPEFSAPPASQASTPEWTKTFGGSSYTVWDVIQTSDGGYALAGDTHSYGPVSGTTRVAAWLAKTDATGTLLWEKTFGALSSYAYSIVQTTDGGYALAGANDGDMYLIRTSADGNLLWEKTYLNPYNSYYLHDGGPARSIFQTNEGGFVMTGDIYFASSSNDVWLVKTDSNGNMEWNKAYSEVSAHAAETGKSVVQTADGGYAIAADDSNLLYLIKTDPSGNLQWSKTFGSQYSSANSLVQTTDGGYALAGTTYQGLVTGAVLVKTDGSGNLQWSRVYNQSSIQDYCCVVQLTDQGYALAATASSSTVTLSDIWLAKIAPNGELQWNATYGGPGYDICSSLVLTRDDGFAVAGYTYFVYGYEDGYLIKITGGNLIPEYPQILLLTALILATAVVAIQLPSVRRNKVAHERNCQP